MTTMQARGNAAVVGTVLVTTLLFGAAAQLQAVRERIYPPTAETEDSLYIRSGIAMRRLTLAYNALAADLYWIRAIQYYGGGARKLQQQALSAPAVPDPPPALAAVDQAYPLLYPMLDITTTLDPRFTIAYRFGAVFLGEAYPRGAGRPDLAIALLQKGLAVRPDKWEYMEDIGFVNYWFVHDFHAAAEWFEKAADAPGAPWWLRSLAATTLAQGGDRRSSRAVWEAIRQSAENDWLRRESERRLMQLQALDAIDALQRLVDEHGSRTTEAPTWSSLVRARLLRGIPLDPTGVPYDLTSGGRVRLSPRSPLWPPPEEPAGAARPGA
jgi:tetratricopeptide (TPR) repeat protein